jgi:hypothetical protein
VPKQPPTTPESDVPLTERVKRLTGQYRGDVRLPAEGRRDPRLGASPEDVRSALGEATRGLKSVRKLAGRR